MATSSTGGSSQNSGSDQEDPQQQRQLVDQRKRKRMLSNRESARRSRLRKQKHLDDLVSQVDQLKKDNSQITTSVNLTTQLYLNIEAENSVLRAQMAELTHRLQSLNEIISYINSSTASCNVFDQHQIDQDYTQMMIGPDVDGFMMNPWTSLPPALNQPIMASADQMYMY